MSESPTAMQGIHKVVDMERQINRDNWKRDCEWQTNRAQQAEAENERLRAQLKDCVGGAGYETLSELTHENKRLRAALTKIAEVSSCADIAHEWARAALEGSSDE